MPVTVLSRFESCRWLQERISLSKSAQRVERGGLATHLFPSVHAGCMNAEGEAVAPGTMLWSRSGSNPGPRPINMLA